MSSLARPLQWPPIFPLDKSLVLWLPLDDRSGSKALDRSRKQYHATITGATWATVGRRKCLYFDGVSNHADTPAIPMNGYRTLMAFTKPGFNYNDGALHTLMEWWSSATRKMFLGKHSDNKVYTVHDSTADGGAYIARAHPITFSAGEVHHIATVFGTSTLSLYWDGAFAGSISNAGAVSLTGTHLLEVGGHNWGYWKGHVWDVRNYAEILSAARIKRIYESEMRIARS